MRTLVLSDIHLGNDGDYDIFAGADALPALLDSCAETSTRVVLNGDTVDFLLDDEPLALSVERAVDQARAITGAPSSAPTFAALGRILAAGGEIILRVGNHDVELALAEVQEVIRGALAQPPHIAARLVFQRGDQPAVLEVGGARVLIAHGEHADPWNRLDYDNLPGPGAATGIDGSAFRHPPGSLLVKTLLNPLKRDHRMRFADLLKPDFHGAVLTALAVDPGAVKLVFQASTLSLMWQLFRRMDDPTITFDKSEPEPDLGLAAALDSAGLTEDEREAIAAEVHPLAPLAYAGGGDALLGRARLKLARAGLRFYARMHRAVASAAGQAYFALQPTDAEWVEARRLARKFGANAVVTGHTHAARFRHEADLAFVNTGTWIWLMRLPDADAGDDAWVRFLEACQSNPALDPDLEHAVPLVTRFTGCLLEPRPDGASIALVEYRPGRGLIRLQQARVAREPSLAAGEAG